MAQTWSYITQYGVVGRRDFGDCVRHGKVQGPPWESEDLHHRDHHHHRR